MTIVYGLLGLGIIVFIHELGHFITARLCGVTVETFSIGMGPVLVRKKYGKTEYRISLLPLGGYCGMKGEHAFQNAVQNNLSYIPKEENSFYGVHPLKRAFIAFAGPLYNFLFAIIALSIVAGVGYSYYTTSNKIILADDIYPEVHSTAREAGIKTGDKILSIDGTKTPYFSDISEQIALNAKKTIILEVKRENQLLTIPVKTNLNKETGAGYIGIVNWVNPIVNNTEPGSGAANIHLQAGDLITSVDGERVTNTNEVKNAFKGKKSVSLGWLRNNIKMTDTLILNNGKAGISFHIEKINTPHYNFIQAIGQGTINTVNMLKITIKSIGLLFKGIDITKAVSGPIRITVMLGESTKAGFLEGFSTGIITVCNFIAIISISLFLMNLLPIPILDGGLILFALIEFFRKKAVKPQIIYKVQFIGIAFIAFIFIFALFGDIKYLITGN